MPLDNGLSKAYTVLQRLQASRSGDYGGSIPPVTSRDSSTRPSSPTITVCSADDLPQGGLSNSHSHATTRNYAREPIPAPLWQRHQTQPPVHSSNSHRSASVLSHLLDEVISCRDGTRRDTASVPSSRDAEGEGQSQRDDAWFDEDKTMTAARLAWRAAPMNQKRKAEHAGGAQQDGWLGSHRSSPLHTRVVPTAARTTKSAFALQEATRGISPTPHRTGGMTVTEVERAACFTPHHLDTVLRGLSRAGQSRSRCSSHAVSNTNTRPLMHIRQGAQRVGERDSPRQSVLDALEASCTRKSLDAGSCSSATRDHTYPRRSGAVQTPAPLRGLSTTSPSAYVEELCTASPLTLQEELVRLGDVHKDSILDRVTSWVTLTTLMNTRGVLEEVVVPRLMEECNCFISGAVNRPLDIGQVVGALMGLGRAARGAVPVLVDLLVQHKGEPQLVSMALRAVGGEEGVGILCKLLQGSGDVFVQSAAAYGLGAMPYPVAGHTQVYCVGSPIMQEETLFYQPPYCSGGREGAEADGDLTGTGPPLQQPPPYRVTHIIWSSDSARQRLLGYVASNGMFDHSGSPSQRMAILREYLSDMHDVCTALGPLGEAEAAAMLKLKTCAQERVPQPSGAGLSQVLPYSYVPHFAQEEALLFDVEHALVQVLWEDTALSIKEQALVSLASLPPVATKHVAQPVMDFLQEVLSTSMDDGGVVAPRAASVEEASGEWSKEKLCIAGGVAVGKLLTDATPQRVAKQAIQLLQRMMCSSRWKVRHAACIGLGELGVIIADDPDVVSHVAQCLLNGSIAPETASWALARLGCSGMRMLLQLIPDERLSRESQLACARSVPSADLREAATRCGANVTEWVIEVEEALGELIVSCASLDTEAKVACVLALVSVVRRQEKKEGDQPPPPAAGSRQWQEAQTYCHEESPNGIFTVLKALLERAALPPAVQAAIFTCLCRHGGAYGEVYISQTATRSSNAGARAAAVTALRACGPNIIRYLIAAMNDEAEEVRREGFDTLDHIGAGAVVQVLQHRPPQQRQEVIAGLRECLLRDLTRNVRRAAAQELYRLLSSST